MAKSKEEDAGGQEASTSSSPSSPSSPLPYPRGAFFILAGYLLERFVYYGLFGGAVFYMQRMLGFTSSSAKTVKAVMEGLIYLAPIAGAVLADTYLGKVSLSLYQAPLLYFFPFLRFSYFLLNLSTFPSFIFLTFFIFLSSFSIIFIYPS